MGWSTSTLNVVESTTCDLGLGFRVHEVDRLRVGWLNGSYSGVPREQKIFKGHLPRIMHHQVY